MSRLQLLGQARLLLEDTTVDIPPKQALLFASYLAYKEDWVSRDELLHLFWPDDDERTARHNLSQLLYHCKQQRWIDNLETERNRVRWLIDTDVRLFREALGDGNWHTALGYYQGRLLDGVTTDDAFTFEDWLMQERQALHSAWREAVLKHAEQLEADSQYSYATTLLRDVLKQDPLAEDILQAYMRCLIQDNQRDLAVKAFESFAQHLRQELAMEPLTSTQDLLHITPVQAPAPKKVSPSLYNFPNFLTPFIGRTLELAELSRLFAETRLLTLLGFGGAGKSRLAVAFAREQVHLIRDGAVFIELAALDDASHIPRAVLEALKLEVSPQQVPLSQLLNYLKDKEVLLVFDNFEHLLEGSSLIIEILEASAASKAIVTSREALDFHAELIYDVGGLNYPDAVIEAPEAYDAVTLFLRSARRANPNFTLTAENKAAVIRLCQMVQGFPLGLELAASWLRLLGPQDIVEEVVRNLDVLAVSHKDLSERHRSMRAVFEHSWALLSDSEQEALKTLAVFRGGFSKDAAEVVTGTKLRTLLSLINKSLLQRTQEGRFERHVVVWQFSFEKLAENRKQLTVFKRRHAEYFAELAEKSASNLSGAKQLTYLENLDRELNNFRAALNWTHQEDPQLSLRLAAALSRYWEMRGYYTEGSNWLTKVLTLAKAVAYPELRASALNGLGNISRLQGNLPQARASLEESLSIYRQMGLEPNIAQVLSNLGLVLRTQGEYAQARELLLESLALQRKYTNDRGIAMVLNNLAIVAFWYGDNGEAQHLLEESLTIVRKLEDNFGIANVLNNLGNALRCQGHYPAAQKVQEESLAIFRILKGQHGISQVLNNLALVAIELGRYDRAFDYLQEGLALKREAKDLMGEAQVLTNLGSVALCTDNLSEAAQYLAQALQLHQAFQDRVGIAVTRNIQGDVARAQKDYARAKNLHLEALDLFEQLEDKLGQAEALANLGHIAYFECDYLQAEKLCKESLKLHYDSNNARGIAEAYELMALVLTETAQAERAAVVWAAADAIRQRINSSLSEAEQRQYAQHIQGVKRQVGRETFNRAWTLGHHLSESVGVELALGNLDTDVAYALMRHAKVTDS